MSQPPRNRFGFPGPKTVTATATRTTRIPGTKATTTESRTTVTEVNTCREIPRASGLQAPGSISGPAQPLAQSTPVPCPARSQPVPCPARSQPSSAQPARGLRPPSQGIPQATPTGAIPRQIATPSGIPPRGLRPPTAGIRPPASAIPFSRGQQLAVPSQGTPDRKTPSPGSLAPKVERTRASFLPKMAMPRKPYGIGPNVPSVLTKQPAPYQRKSPREGLAVCPNLTPVSLENQVNESLIAKSSEKPKKKVSAKGKRVTTVEPEMIQTPAGRERVLQKAVFEERVERGAEGEKIVKNLAVSEFDEAAGESQVVEVGVQQLDPKLPTKDRREIVGVTSTVSVSPSYTVVAKKVVRTVTEPLDKGITMKPAAVAQLVREEKEDVENTLKMMPPDLSLAPGIYETKQRQQQLRLHSESMALLEESIIRPDARADEAITDPSPEAMANMMHTVENDISPKAAPDQVFHSLFTEPAAEQYIKMSSVSPGPLQDVVVPTEDVARNIHQEPLSDKMDKLADKFAKISDPEQVPYVDIFTKVMDDMKKSPEKGKNKPRTFQPISDEKSLWVNAELEHLVNVVGAEPADVLSAFDVAELTESGELEKEMTNGVEFYVDTDAVQYMNRIQLRGTQLPSYFPGYMVAVPDFPGIVQLARSPDEVFATAWKSVQPKYFPDNSLSALSF